MEKKDIELLREVEKGNRLGNGVEATKDHYRLGGFFHEKVVSLYDDRESIAMPRKCVWLNDKVDESLIECLPYSSKDRIFHTWNLDVAPAFVYMYETFMID